MRSFVPIVFCIICYGVSSTLTPVLSEVNIAAAFDVLQETDGTPVCVTLQGLQIKAAILMALQELNSKTDGLYDQILPDVSLNLTSFHYSESSSAMLGTKMIEDFEKYESRSNANESIVSCLGPTYNNLGEGNCYLIT